MAEHRLLTRLLLERLDKGEAEEEGEVANLTPTLDPNTNLNPNLQPSLHPSLLTPTLIPTLTPTLILTLTRWQRWRRSSSSARLRSRPRSSARRGGPACTSAPQTTRYCDIVLLLLTHSLTTIVGWYYVPATYYVLTCSATVACVTVACVRHDACACVVACGTYLLLLLTTTN